MCISPCPTRPPRSPTIPATPFASPTTASGTPRPARTPSTSASTSPTDRKRRPSPGPDPATRAWPGRSFVPLGNRPQSSDRPTVLGRVERPLPRRGVERQLAEHDAILERVQIDAHEVERGGQRARDRDHLVEALRARLRLTAARDRLRDRQIRPVDVVQVARQSAVSVAIELHEPDLAVEHVELVVRRNRSTGTGQELLHKNLRGNVPVRPLALPPRPAVRRVEPLVDDPFRVPGVERVGMHHRPCVATGRVLGKSLSRLGGVRYDYRAAGRVRDLAHELAWKLIPTDPARSAVHLVQAREVLVADPVGDEGTDRDLVRNRRQDGAPVADHLVAHLVVERDRAARREPLRRVPRRVDGGIHQPLRQPPGPSQRRGARGVEQLEDPRRQQLSAAQATRSRRRLVRRRLVPRRRFVLRRRHPPAGIIESCRAPVSRTATAARATRSAMTPDRIVRLRKRLARRLIDAWETIRDRPSGRAVRAVRDAADPLVHASWVAATWLRTRDPTTLNEKVKYKMLHDRRPILTTLTDKVDVRDVVRDRIGVDHLTHLFQVHDDAAAVRWDELPREFACKVTHASGGTIIVTDSADPDRPLPTRLVPGHGR